MPICEIVLPPSTPGKLILGRSLSRAWGKVFGTCSKEEDATQPARCGNLPDNRVGFGGAGGFGSRAGWQLVWGGASSHSIPEEQADGWLSSETGMAARILAVGFAGREGWAQLYTRLPRREAAGDDGPHGAPLGR